MLSMLTFPLYKFFFTFFIFGMSFFLRDHNGNSLQIFYPIAVAIDFQLFFHDSITISLKKFFVYLYDIPTYLFWST